MKSPYPVGTFSAHWFQLFNAISFQILMGAPIIVFAKSLGASSTVLGIIASFTPLMTVFQLPAARHLDKYGYRQFVLMGWSLRTIFIFVIAVVPLLFFLDNTSRMAVLLAALFFFNLLRGISTAAWLPWITSLIPEQVRGRFLSIDQLFMYVGCLLSLLASAWVMRGEVNSWEFSFAFLISAGSATVSLFFIRRMPEVAANAVSSLTSQKVPWRAMLGYAPFRELIVFNIIYTVVVGSLGVFTVEYLRDASHFNIASVLYLSAFSFAGALIVLPFSGRIVDQTGSKPLLRLAVVILAAVIAMWTLCAANVFPTTLWLVAGMNLMAGMATGNFNLANVRITMSTMPEMGRNHFFALFTVITSLGLGASPIVWGLALDFIGSYEVATGVFHWKRHSFYFAALFLLNVLTFLYIPRLHEMRGAGSMEPSLIYARLKRSPRVWQR